MFNKNVVAREVKACTDYNVKEVEEVLELTFDFVRAIMKSGDRDNYDFKNIRLFNFGIFGVKPGRINHLKKKDAKKDNKNNFKD